jgi:alpha-D-ribose 1-methylphosphonate 5-triphosphate synthase subunit PhnH
MTVALELAAGFADKVTSAQATFRAVMQAMARPGTVQRLDVDLRQVPTPLMPATAAIALTLFDHDTPLWLDDAMRAAPSVAQWLRFHTSAPLVDDAADASFALIAAPDAMPALDCFAFGTNDYPDRSTTLILQLDSLEQGDEFELSGPGIRGAATLRAPLPESLVAQHEANHVLFPRGIDLILIANDAVVVIPRTNRIVAKGGH